MFSLLQTSVCSQFLGIISVFKEEVWTVTKKKEEIWTILGISRHSSNIWSRSLFLVRKKNWRVLVSIYECAFFLLLPFVIWMKCFKFCLEEDQSYMWTPTSLKDSTLCGSYRSYISRADENDCPLCGSSTHYTTPVCSPLSMCKCNFERLNIRINISTYKHKCKETIKLGLQLMIFPDNILPPFFS